MIHLLAKSSTDLYSNLGKGRYEVVLARGIWQCSDVLFSCYYGTFREVTEALGNWISLLIKEMALTCLLEYTYCLIMFSQVLLYLCQLTLLPKEFSAQAFEEVSVWAKFQRVYSQKNPWNSWDLETMHKIKCRQCKSRIEQKRVPINFMTLWCFMGSYRHASSPFRPSSKLPKFYAQNNAEGLFCTLVHLLIIHSIVLISYYWKTSLWDIRMSFTNMNFPSQDNNTVCSDYNDTFTNWHVSY